MPIAERPQAFQELRCCRIDPSLPLDRLHEDRDGLRGDRSLDGSQIIEGDMRESLDQRRKAGLHLLLPRGADSTERPAMEGMTEGDDLMPPRGGAELPGQLVEPFVRLGTAVAEEDLPAEAEQIDDQLGKFPLRPREVEIGGVDQLCGLFGNGFDQGGMGMTEGRDGDPGTEIEIRFSCFVPNPASLPPRQGKIEPAVSRHHIVPV